MKHKFRFKNGDIVECKLSGFTGTIDCSAIWINGCERYSVMPRVSKDGKMAESFWIDGAQLKKIGNQVEKIKASKTGGPTEKSTSARF